MANATSLNMEGSCRRYFDDLAEDYEAQYDDPTSQAYRDRFIHEPLLGALPLEGARVLDAMCGSGQVTRYLVDRGAKVDGLDLSENNISRYRRRWPGCRAFCASILESNLEDETYDCVVVVGGLQYLDPFVDQAMDEIHRLLKPGGYFCFFEPHRGSLPDIARSIWYRVDRHFEGNESSVDVEGLKLKNARRFEVQFEKHFGNLAFLLILNSLVFRIPLRLKRWIAPVLFPIERVVNALQGRLLSCVVISRWRKRER